MPEGEEKPKAAKPKLTDAEKVTKAVDNLKDVIAKTVSNEDKSEEAKFLGGISKSAIKAHLGGKKADWIKIGNEIAIFTREADPTVAQVKKALTDLSIFALSVKAEKGEDADTEDS